MPDITFIYPIAASVGALAAVIGYHVFQDKLKPGKMEKAFSAEGDIPPEAQPEIFFDGGKIEDAKNPNSIGEGYNGKVFKWKKIHNIWDLWVFDKQRKNVIELLGLEFGDTIMVESNAGLVIGRVRLRCRIDATGERCEWNVGGLEKYREQTKLVEDNIAKQKMKEELRAEKEFSNLFRAPRFLPKSSEEEKKAVGTKKEDEYEEEEE